MDEDLKLIVDGVERLLVVTRRLSQENAALRERLGQAQARADESQAHAAAALARVEEAQTRMNEAQSHNELLKRRSAEARARVEAALERLPSLTDLGPSSGSDDPLNASDSPDVEAPTTPHTVAGSPTTPL